MGHTEGTRPLSLSPNLLVAHSFQVSATRPTCTRRRSAGTTPAMSSSTATQPANCLWYGLDVSIASLVYYKCHPWILSCFELPSQSSCKPSRHTNANHFGVVGRFACHFGVLFPDVMAQFIVAAISSTEM
jgi:hypothetical protein